MDAHTEPWILVELLKFLPVGTTAEALKSLTLVSAGWLALRVPAAILSEYTKRAWFRWVHPETINKERAETNKAHQELNDLRNEFLEYKKDVADFIEDYEESQQEITALRNELTKSRQDNLKLQKRLLVNAPIK